MGTKVQGTGRGRDRTQSEKTGVMGRDRVRGTERGHGVRDTGQSESATTDGNRETGKGRQINWS